MVQHHPERLIPVDGAEICSDAFGQPGDPALLLIMGLGSSMLIWEEHLCRRLASEGRFVIRFDNRDTGRSTAYPPGRPTYSLHDMALDAVSVLDHHEVDRAHVEGNTRSALTRLAARIELERAWLRPRRIGDVTLPDPTGMQAAGDIDIADQLDDSQSDLSRVWVMAQVPEERLAELSPGMTAEVRVRAYPDRVFPARVTRIGTELDPATRTVQVRCETANPRIALKTGMYAAVRLLSGTKREATVVPAGAVQILLPKSATDENVVWDGGDHVRVTGREGRFTTATGSLRLNPI